MPEDFANIRSGSSGFLPDELNSQGESEYHGPAVSTGNPILDRLPRNKKRVPKKEILFQIKLPASPSEVKERASTYVIQQTYASPQENYKYKQWCIYVPDPSNAKDAKRRSERITKLVNEIQEGIGGAMGKNALFLTFVKDNGEVDFGVAGQIVNALNLKRNDAPLLLICNKPVLRISIDTEKKNRLRPEDTMPDMIVIKFRGSTEDEVHETLNLLKDELAKQDNNLTAKSISRSRFGLRLLLALKNITKTAVAAVPIILGFNTGKKK